MFRLLPALGLLVALAFQGQSASAYHRWNNYHWARTKNPFTLTYRANVSSTWSTLVTKVIGEWNSVYTRKPGAFDVVNYTKVSSGGKLYIESGNYGATGWFGLATVTANILNGHITYATVQVNDYYFTGPYNTTTSRDHVLCQEVGHTIGLTHNELPFVFGKSCMDDNNSTLDDPAFQTPNNHDAAELNTIYKHKDSYTSAGQRAELGPTVTEVIDIVPA